MLDDNTEKLYNLDKYTDDVIYKLQKLCLKKSKNELVSMIKKYNERFKKQYHDKSSIDLSELEVLSESLYGLDHINFEWTLNLVDDAYDSLKKLQGAEKRLAFAKSIQSLHNDGKLRWEDDLLMKVAKKKKKKKIKKKGKDKLSKRR